MSEPNENEEVQQNELLDEIVLKDTEFKTPGFLEFERRNTLVNKIRSEFFGEELNNGSIANVLKELNEKMKEEFAAAEKELKGYSVKSYSSAIAEAEKQNKTSPRSTSAELEAAGKKVKAASEAALEKRKTELKNQYANLTEMLDWLHDNRNAELTFEQYSEWAGQINTWGNVDLVMSNPNERMAKKEPARGPAEIQLKSICDSIGKMMAARVKYETENNFTVPLMNQCNREEWTQRIQAYFANPDFEHSFEYYGPNMTNREYAKKNLESRLGEVVTAIYTGKLILPGLEIGNYWANDSVAPYETAKELLETVGGFPFLGENARLSFLPGKIKQNYNEWKDNKTYQFDQQKAVTRVMKQGDFKALSRLGIGPKTAEGDFRNWFAKTAEPELKEELTKYIEQIRDGVKDKEGKLFKWEEFKTLNEIKENTKEAVSNNQRKWETTEAKYNDKAVKQILSDRFNSKEATMYKKVSQKYLQDRFDDRVKEYWREMGIQEERISGSKGQPYGEGTVYGKEISRTIAAHLCAAHLSDDEIIKGKISKGVLPLFHQPKMPIDDESIKETREYFKKMLAKTYPNVIDAFEDGVFISDIKDFYHSAVKNLEKDETRSKKPENEERNMDKVIRKAVEAHVTYGSEIKGIKRGNKIAMKEGNLLSPQQYKAPWKLDKDTENTIKTAAGEMIEKQKVISVDMSKQFVELYKIGQENNRKISRQDMLSMLLEGVSGEKEPEKVKKNLMKSANSLKRGWLATLFNRNLNKAGSDLRKMLNNIAAKAPGEELSAKEMRELNNTAKTLKESIDHGGATLTDGEIKKLKEIDQNRYTMALKVLDTLEKKMMKGGVLFEQEMELVAEGQPGAMNKVKEDPMSNLTM